MAATALVAAESILALTPIAIKKTPVDPINVLWSRILSSAGIGYAVAGDVTLKGKEIAGAVALGGTNLLHIASSYESFRHLPAGQAMSLLYTYPVWNLLLAAWYGSETIGISDVLTMSVAAAGSVILNLDPAHTAAVTTPTTRGANSLWGIFMGLIMAITESGMHQLLKQMKWLDAAKAVWIVNGSAGIWLTAILALQLVVGGSDLPPLFGGATHIGDFVWLSVFHGITLFSGYWLRYYAVPRLSTVSYSILSYAGLLAAFVFGSIFVGEWPGWMSLVGALLIFVSGAALQFKDLYTQSAK